MNIAAINGQIKEFLIYGADDDVGDSPIDEIDQCIQKFKFRYEKEHIKSKEFMHDVITLKAKAEEKLLMFDDPNIIDKFQHYTKLHVKIQHLNIFKAIQKLEKYKSIEEIPDIILGSFNDIPNTLFTRSKIYKYLLQTTKRIRSSILQTFHKMFEEHLVGKNASTDENENEDDDVANHNRNFSQSLQNDGVDLWTKFLTTSTVWLLSFSLLSVLPVVLTRESHQRVSEVYQEALDEAFTPIWGRFHYHLEVARQARTKSHVVWTFNYAKSFVQMLADLCAQLTVCGKLEHLCPIDYNDAGRKHVSDKSIRFLRAHIAQIIEDFTPLSNTMCIQLVEENFELQQVLETIDPSSCVLAASGGSISSVFYDSKDLFHQWLMMEVNYFSSSIKSKCCTVEYAYGFDFGDAPKPVDEDEPRRQYKCYRGVYESISLAVSACQRYRLLPKAAQLILSECVVEPLLCVMIGLYLLRIRSQSDLFSISCGDFKSSEVCKPSVMFDFSWCVLYAEDCLSAASTHGSKMSASSQRLRVKWSEIQNWIPKTLIHDANTRLSDLISMCFKLSPKYTGTQYAYRNSDSLAALDSSSGNGFLKLGKKDSSPLRANALDTIQECFELTGGMIGTLDTVMERQYKNLNK